MKFLFEKFLIVVFVCLFSVSLFAEDVRPTADETARIRAAAPSKASVSPKKARKLLVFNRNDGFFHSAIPYGAKAIEILAEKSGAFEAVISDDYNVFTPEKLAEYDTVFFNNTTGLKFPDLNHRKALMDFVRNGGGFGGLHGATDNFPEWLEASKLLGGKFDGHPWGGGDTKWAFKLTDAASPINKAFGGKGFKLADEIYVFNTFQQDDLHVLLELDLSDRTTANFGKERLSVPVSWIRDFGKGRVFYCSFGHNHDVFWNEAVLGHLLDGLQFALGDLDADTTPNYSDLGQFKGWLESFSGYEYGDGFGLLDRIGGFIKDNYDSPGILGRVEVLMADLLGSDATLASKHFICRQLSAIATDKSVEVLGEMLKDAKTFDMSLYVLRRASGSEADQCLIAAYKRASDTERIAIINTLGARDNAEVVGTLAGMTRSPNGQISAAAIQAMGRIGTTEAAAFIAKMINDNPHVIMHSIVYDAYIKCGESLAAAGDEAEAIAIFKSMFKDSLPLDIQFAAMRGIVVNDSIGGGKLLLDVLKTGDEELLPYAIALVSEIESEQEIKSITGRLPRLSVSGQVQMLSALADCKNPAASRGAIIKAVDSNETEVRIAAIKALAVAGDESSVMLLALKAAKTGGEEQNAVRESLYRLSGSKVDDAIVSRVASSGSNVKVELIRAIGKRRSNSAVATLLASSQDNDAKVRRESFVSLKAVGGIEDLGEMVDLLVSLKSSSATSQLESAITAVASKSSAVESRAGAVLSALDKVTDMETRCSLLRICGKIGDEAALGVLRESLDDGDRKVSDAAFRSLVEWPGSSPMDDMLLIATNSDDKVRKILAIRGYVRMVSIPANRTSGETVKLLAQVMKVAGHPEEKKLVLSALPKFICDDAIKLAQLCLDDVEMKAEAEIAINKIHEVLNNKKVTVSASCKNDQARNAVDGDMSTRWDTGKGMSPGDWFMIDLGFEDSIRKIILDATGSDNDYPRGYEVYSSYDGGNWGMPILTEEMGKKVTEIKFKEPLRTRFVKIVQTGKDGLFWSIHELKVEYNR